MPHRAAGTRTEPPVSVPMAMGASPLATATPDPLLEPPSHTRGVPGVASGPVVVVAACAVEGELRHVQLADAVGPGCL